MESRGSAFIAALSKVRSNSVWPRDAVRCSGVLPWESLYRAEAPCSNRADTQSSLPNMACRGSAQDIMLEENTSWTLRTLYRDKFLVYVIKCVFLKKQEMYTHTCTANTLTALCNAVKPFLSAASAFAPFSNRMWTQSVWRPRAASMRAVLHMTKKII